MNGLLRGSACGTDVDMLAVKTGSQATRSCVALIVWSKLEVYVSKLRWYRASSMPFSVKDR
jgi:hypothetical protein